jgi:hypothetical protein
MKDNKSRVPVYVQRAQQKYYEKIKSNPEYNDKKKVATVECRKEHREEYNQYMREYRARKKEEKKQANIGKDDVKID